MAELESSLTDIGWLHGRLPNRKSEGEPSWNRPPVADALKTEPQEGVADPRSVGQTGQNAHFKDGKPVYSYANLIMFAIRSSPRGKMTLSEIYQWICDTFPYYRSIGSGWKVSCEA